MHLFPKFPTKTSAANWYNLDLVLMPEFEGLSYDKLKHIYYHEKWTIHLLSLIVLLCNCFFIKISWALKNANLKEYRALSDFPS